MNKLYFFTLLLGFSLSVSAQSASEKTVNATSVDPRISEVYAAQTSQIASDPQRLKDLNGILNRYVIITEKLTPSDKFPKLSTVPLFNKYNPNLTRDAVVNKDNFNILKYDLDFYSKYTKVYRIDNTDFILVIEPQN